MIPTHRDELIIGLIVAISLMGIIFYFASNKVKNNVTGNTIKNISDNNSKNKLSVKNTTNESLSVMEQIKSKSAELIDVREISEWSAGHISGSRLISYSEISANKVLNLPKDKTVYVYCATGKRADEAVKILIKEGFHAVSLGGMDDVQKIGGIIVK